MNATEDLFNNIYNINTLNNKIKINKNLYPNNKKNKLLNEFISDKNVKYIQTQLKKLFINSFDIEKLKNIMKKYYVITLYNELINEINLDIINFKFINNFDNIYNKFKSMGGIMRESQNIKNGIPILNNNRLLNNYQDILYQNKTFFNNIKTSSSSNIKMVLSTFKPPLNNNYSYTRKKILYIPYSNNNYNKSISNTDIELNNYDSYENIIPPYYKI
tara:strand:- start:126 stop:776 length:651 start_codon:yes stop_codon:yes gene_type:complete